MNDNDQTINHQNPNDSIIRAGEASKNRSLVQKSFIQEKQSSLDHHNTSYQGKFYQKDNMISPFDDDDQMKIGNIQHHQGGNFLESSKEFNFSKDKGQVVTNSQMRYKLDRISEMSNEGTGTSQSKDSISSSMMKQSIETKQESDSSDSDEDEDEDEGFGILQKHIAKTEEPVPEKPQVIMEDKDFQIEDARMSSIELLLQGYSSMYEEDLLKEYGFALMESSIQIKDSLLSDKYALSPDQLSNPIELIPNEKKFKKNLKKKLGLTFLKQKILDFVPEDKVASIETTASTLQSKNPNFKILMKVQLACNQADLNFCSKTLTLLMFVKHYRPGVYHHFCIKKIRSNRSTRGNSFISDSSSIDGKEQSTLQFSMDPLFNPGPKKPNKSMTLDSGIADQGENSRFLSTSMQGEGMFSNMNRTVHTQPMINPSQVFKKNTTAVSISSIQTSLSDVVGGKDRMEINASKCHRKFEFIRRNLGVQIKRIVFNPKVGQYKITTFEGVKKKKDFYSQINYCMKTKDYASMLNLIMQKVNKISLSFEPNQFQRIYFKIEGEKLVQIDVEFQNKKEANKIGSLVIVRLLVKFVYQAIENETELVDNTIDF